jgi:molecular chaperone DnaK (HSP70)
MTAVSPVDAPPRYVIGIDLGTTNCAVCFVDAQRPDWRVRTFRIPQVAAPGETESLEILPSFHYQGGAQEFSAGALNLPWDRSSPRTVVGLFAREQGKLVPGRVSESAKSWLCHPGVDRTSPLLPWHGDPEVPRLSPVEISAASLRHIREAWNQAYPQAPCEQQDVVITLPASFDEVARALTIEAAKLAGLPRVLLIEEPQAAFYAWIHRHAEDWQTRVSPGQNILVCDIGGGTTDFTLIRAQAHPEAGVQFQRIAVGDHLILGGDNLDLALAQHVERRLLGERKLDPRQWGSLVRICRHVKETLLSEPAPETYTIALPSSGARLIGGGQQILVSREEVRTLLLEGFFPPATRNDRPQRTGSGFQEFGLPYAADAAVTRHLAAFLAGHAQSGGQLGAAGSARPDLVLFNGGVCLSPLVRERVINSLTNWFGGESDWAPIVLENPRHDLAVAQGAAYYGMVRRGQGVRIAAGLPRTYYIGIESTAADGASHMQALCLMPAGAEPGQEVHIEDRVFQLTVAAPVEFPAFHSSLRLADPPGALIPIEREQLTLLPPIRTVLRSRKEKQASTLPVKLHARLTEIGTLEAWCSEADGKRTWQLQFDVRSATQTDRAAHQGAGEAAGVLESQTIEDVRALIAGVFAQSGQDPPGGLAKRLAQLLEMPREAWPPSLLRQIWEMLLDCESGRTKSAEHEGRWLNLLGFALRPGYGLALDDWRVDETWKKLRGKLHFPTPAVLPELWILWRRAAGGLAAGQQLALATPLLTRLREERKKGRPRGKGSQDGAEGWRMLGALERLPAALKQELGDICLHLLADPGAARLAPALWWTLARLGSRAPLYGPLNEVVAPAVAQAWVRQIIDEEEATPERFLAAMQLARRTGDRSRDIPEETRQRVATWLDAHGAAKHYGVLVREGGQLEDQTAGLIFGDSLPPGLRLTSTLS